jgi:hypothetical protein
MLSYSVPVNTNCSFLFKMENSSSRTAGDEWLKEAQRIEDWLRELQLASTTDEKEREKFDPTTPHRRTAETTEVEGVSPTDTSFSGPSIFDQRPRSPCPQRHFLNDASNATSIDDDEGFEAPKPKRISPPLYQQNKIFKPSNVTRDVDPETYHDPHIPRLTSILSCLQCTSASLPCSRTLPSCTRCIRASKASSCLVLRSRHLSEIVSASHKACTSPVLLKLVDDDDEAIWNQKMKEREKIKGEWERKRDSENWVLPRVDTEVRGGWKSWRRDREVKDIEGEMGEGVGRRVFVELRVVGVEEME